MRTVNIAVKVVQVLVAIYCITAVAWAYLFFCFGWVVNDDTRAIPVVSVFLEKSCKATGGTFFEDYSCGYGQYGEE